MRHHLAALIILAGCTPAPQIAGAPGVASPSAAPALVPLSPILAQADAAQSLESPDAALAARAAALRLRAAALRAR